MSKISVIIPCYNVELWIDRCVQSIVNQTFGMEHIFSAYLQGLKTAIWRYEVPNYNYYRLLRELILQRIPDYTTNPYIQRGILKEIYKLMMVALVNELSKTEFLQFAENLKKIVI